MEIMKRIKFCYAHRLKNHENKCANLHGHNAMVDIFVNGETLDSVGRLVDFKDIKIGLGQWIDQYWDHAFIYNENDNVAGKVAQVLCDFGFGTRCFALPYNPTAENMVIHLIKIVTTQFNNSDDYRISKIRVWETDTAYAEGEIAQ